MRAVGRFDRFQRRHPLVAMPLAVVYKFFDDHGNYLAAMLTYYAFVAIFPLMLLGSSILGLVLGARPELREDILESALGQFPIIGDQLGRPEGLQGSISGVTIGALAALYGAMGLGQSLQHVQHVAWSVPRHTRPNPFHARLKTLVLLLTAGLSLLGVSVLTTVVTTTDLAGRLDTGLRVLLPVFNVVLVGTGLTLLFRFAASGQHSFRRSAPGGYSLALMWQALQLVGAWYVALVLVGATAMTETFGLVLGLMAFLFVGAVMAVLAIEVNVVIARRLYPRALLTPFTDEVDPTHADRRAYASYARAQRHKGWERISVSFRPPPEEDTPDEPADESPGDQRDSP